MRRAIILAACVALSGHVAQAQNLITIDEVRAAAETGVPPLITSTDVDVFDACHLPPIVPPSTPEMMRAMGEAKAAGVNIQIIWIRHNLPAIETCLKGQHP